jgi:hypothetical protein
MTQAVNKPPDERPMPPNTDWAEKVRSGLLPKLSLYRYKPPRIFRLRTPI